MKPSSIQDLFTALLLGLLMLPAEVTALSDDHEQPIHIRADRLEIDDQRGISTYQGRVELSQGSLQLFADILTVHRSGQGVEKITAKGDPVRFRQQANDADYEIKGQARHIEYLAAKARLELTDQAQLWQGANEFSGARIVYEAEHERVRANGGDGEKEKPGRVHAIIHPRQGGAGQ